MATPLGAVAAPARDGIASAVGMGQAMGVVPAPSDSVAPAPAEGNVAARLWRLGHTPSGRKMIRYTMVSVVSTVISNGMLFIVYGVLGLWSEVPSTIFANLSATGPAYYLNRHWAWGKSGRSHLVREVIPLSIVAAAEARHVSQVHHIHHFGRTVLVLGANIGAFGVLWVLKFLLFNRLF
jgi:putative flippase GtrA